MGENYTAAQSQGKGSRDTAFASSTCLHWSKNTLHPLPLVLPVVLVDWVHCGVPDSIQCASINSSSCVQMRSIRAQEVSTRQRSGQLRLIQFLVLTGADVGQVAAK
jgi:hypothetical protein